MTVPAAHYGKANGWLDNQAAITVHPYGRGMDYYVGVYLDEASQQILMDRILNTAQVQSFNTPPNVEARKCTNKSGEDIYIVINHGFTEQVVQLPWPAVEQLNSHELEGSIKLPPMG